MFTTFLFEVELNLVNIFIFIFQTNARWALTIVATMPPALTPKVPLTVVANQGTEEMVTTVQVGVQLQTLFCHFFFSF